MTDTKKRSGRFAGFFGKLTRVVLAIGAISLSSYWLYGYVQSHGGVKTGFEAAAPKLVQELSLDQAKVLFKPDVTNLHPSLYVVEICNPNADECKAQLAEDETAAADAGTKGATFYHVDPLTQPDLYGALYDALVQAAGGKEIPQAFPMRIVLKVKFKFVAGKPVASLGVADFAEGLVPAGGIVAFVAADLAGPQAAPAPSGPADQTAPTTTAPDGANTPDQHTAPAEGAPANQGSKP